MRLWILDVREVADLVFAGQLEVATVKRGVRRADGEEEDGESAEPDRVPSKPE